MFKFSIILLSIIILVLVGLDSSFFNEEYKKIETKKIVEIRKEKIKKPDERFTTHTSIIEKKIEEKEILEVKKVNIHAKLKKIIEKAKRETDLKKAIEYYNTVIEQSKNSQDVEVLKLFAMAYFNKISIYKSSIKDNLSDIISSYDSIIQKFENRQEIKLLKLYAKAQFNKAYFSERDKTLNIYDTVINKFSKSSDIELLKIYTNAQFYKSYLTTGTDTLDIFNQVIESLKNTNDRNLLIKLYKAQQNKIYILEQGEDNNEEAIEVYDEIIKKFSSHQGEEYQAIVDNAFFQKSFLLMGENDEESMEIYDKIIKDYEVENISNTPVPLKVAYSILNNIELSLITNNDDTNYRELAQKYLSDKKDTKPQLDMLEILRDAQVSNQDKALKVWQEENREYSFTNWSFSELKKWNEQMEEGEQKSRIKSYITEFIKYNNNSRDNYTHVR